MIKFKVVLKTLTMYIKADELSYCTNDLFSFDNYADEKSDEPESICVIPRENVLCILVDEE